MFRINYKLNNLQSSMFQIIAHKFGFSKTEIGKIKNVLLKFYTTLF